MDNDVQAKILRIASFYILNSLFCILYSSLLAEDTAMNS